MKHDFSDLQQHKPYPFLDIDEEGFLYLIISPTLTLRSLTNQITLEDERDLERCCIGDI
jgi:hypothetical protein